MTIDLKLDRVFFKFSSWFADPFCYALEGAFRLISPLNPHVFNNYSTIPKEIAYRFFSSGALIIGAVGFFKIAPCGTMAALTAIGIGCKITRAIAGVLQKNNYTHVKGLFPEKQDLSKLKVMTWNLLGFAGGFHFSCGGARHWRERIDQIAEFIKQENPDVLVLQEIFDTAFVEALMAKLKSEFAHFYCHLGTNNWGIGSGCMVMTKCPVISFSNINFSNNDWKITRCFSVMEVGASQAQYRIIGTHLHSGYTKGDQKKRLKQFDQIMGQISKLPIIPTLIVGDLNIERNLEEGKYLKQHLTHAYSGTQATCTNMLSKKWNPYSKIQSEENVDYISLVTKTGELTVKESHLVEAFNYKHDTKTALSDHHGVVVTYTSKKD